MNSKEIRLTIKNELGYNSREVSVSQDYYGTTLTIRKEDVMHFKVAEFADTHDYSLSVTDEVKEIVANGFCDMNELEVSLKQANPNTGVDFYDFMFFNQHGHTIQLHGHDTDNHLVTIGYFNITDVVNIAYNMAIFEQKMQSEIALPIFKVGDKRYSESYKDKKVTIYTVLDVIIKNNRVSYLVDSDGVIRNESQYGMVHYYHSYAEITKKQHEHKLYLEHEAKNAQMLKQFNNETEIVSLTDGYIVKIEQACLNKNQTLNEYKELVKVGDFDTFDVFVKNVLCLNNQQWEFFTNNLFNRFNNLGSYEYVAVKNIDTKEEIIVNGSGHDYARYVGLICK